MGIKERGFVCSLRLTMTNKLAKTKPSQWKWEPSGLMGRLLLHAFGPCLILLPWDPP